MASSLPLPLGATGLTIYFQIRDGANVWNTTNKSFETYNGADWADYSMSAFEQGSSTIYVAHIPVDIPPGIYDLTAFEQIAGSPAEGDPPIWEGTFEWDGSQILSRYRSEQNVRGADGDTLKTLSDQLDAVVTTGAGNTAVDESTIADDGNDLRYLDGQGSGIGGATVRAYLKLDYDNDIFKVRAQTTTQSDGSWTQALQLDAGFTYVIEFFKPAEFGPDTQEVTV